ncbi:MAG: peptidase S24, partial [Flavobacteriales bacterium]|nr:peptidase S24 [Flavobacteriales bacterium]
MSKLTYIKQRIKYISEKQNIKKEFFFNSIGMTSANFRGEKLYRPINSKAIETILSIYPEINLHWLVTGQGEMYVKDIEVNLSDELEHNYQSAKKLFKLRTDKAESNQEIPLYDIEASAGLVSLFNDSKKTEIVDTLKIPNLPKCDGAVFVTGDSMYPLLKSGDIVAYKQIFDFESDIYWGEMYLISIDMAGEEYTSVKYIQKSE